MSRARRTGGVGLLLLATAALGAPVERTWMNTSDTPAARAQKLLVQMTFDEKAAMLHGSDGPYIGAPCGSAQLGAVV